MTLQQIKYTSSEFRDIDKQLQKNKNSDSKIDQ